MMSKYFKTGFLYLILLLSLIYSVYQVYNSKITYDNPKIGFDEPNFPEGSPWPIKSIDTQIISKYWPNVPQASIKEQVTLLKNLGVNYIAVDTPYDRKNELYMWANEIHSQNLHVWFRSHWDNWEGDDGKPASMTPQEYLDQTKSFIESNPDLFKPGDSFTLAIEPEQTGVGLGKKFRDWNEYRQFVLNEIVYANQGFKTINLKNKIYTNWISVNGWVVQNEFTSDLVNKLGLITIDNYSPQSITIGTLDNPNKISNDMSGELDSYYKQWHTPILLGEWGYQIYQDTNEDTQAAVILKVFNSLKSKPYLVGINYWSHMGNHSRIINDQLGGHLAYRKAAFVISAFFKNLHPPESSSSANLRNFTK